MSHSHSVVRRGSRRPSIAFRPNAPQVGDAVEAFDRIAKQIVDRRAEFGITQHDLAAMVGTTRPVIARIESGRYRTNVSTLERLATALDISFTIGPARATCAPEVIDEIGETGHQRRGASAPCTGEAHG